MSKYNANRITIRLTGEIWKKLEQRMKSGKYLNKSDLLRELIWVGLKHTEE